MLTLVPVLLALGAGLVAGVFFAFSTFVMKALAQLPSEQGVAAMQRINVVVLNPVFLALFVGTALIAGICGVGAVVSWGSIRSALLLAAAVLYVVGCFGVTVAFNVPRNEHLAGLHAGSVEGAAYWQVYLREWVLWNHVRTVASSAAATAATFSLAY
ncbi:MAG: DUF1772 domain-containing protein [Piscinibacter sp.]|uniref:anthrone oxygenase family protein n=1 Tax=Piscinibacter sp. TaxID=1903157 RepID=UPI00258D6649|nr:anthrone oxygenase family protein [Piscinibacter sp.]MCW5664627.1 DUF1772 domain-containing protein [Piscinibacter sp.]